MVPTRTRRRPGFEHRLARAGVDVISRRPVVLTLRCKACFFSWDASVTIGEQKGLTRPSGWWRCRCGANADAPEPSPERFVVAVEALCPA